MANFTNNTAQLQELLAKANALPSDNQYLDELNEITGGASAMTMRSAFSNAESGLSEQNALIRQIQDELSTRTVSGGKASNDVEIFVMFNEGADGAPDFSGNWELQLLKGDVENIVQAIAYNDGPQAVNVGIFIGFYYGGVVHYQYVPAKTVEECWYGSYGWATIFFDVVYCPNRRYWITLDPYSSLPMFMDYEE